MSKKGAMELSVTAIVILILAIVMLGLGLGFIRGMFGKVATQFEQQIATEPEPPAASGSEPITLSRESIITRAGEPEVLKVDVYNPSDGNWDIGGDGGNGGTAECTKLYQPRVWPIPTGYSGCTAPSGSAQGIPAGVLSANAVSGTYMYGRKFSGTASLSCTDIQAPAKGRYTSDYRWDSQSDLDSYSEAATTAEFEYYCETYLGCGDPAGGTTCGGGGGGTTGDLTIECSGLTFGYEANTKSIPVGQSEEFNVLLTIGKNEAAGTYLCGSEVMGYTKDFIIKVTR